MFLFSSTLNNQANSTVSAFSKENRMPIRDNFSYKNNFLWLSFLCFYKFCSIFTRIWQLSGGTKLNNSSFRSSILRSKVYCSHHGSFSCIIAIRASFQYRNNIIGDIYFYKRDNKNSQKSKLSFAQMSWRNFFFFKYLN